MTDTDKEAFNEFWNEFNPLGSKGEYHVAKAIWAAAIHHERQNSEDDNGDRGSSDTEAVGPACSDAGCEHGTNAERRTTRLADG